MKCSKNQNNHNLIWYIITLLSIFKITIPSHTTYLYVYAHIYIYYKVYIYYIYYIYIIGDV